MIEYSLNETASRAKLAAKGAGYPWGMAEEVARGVFWLVCRDLPGPSMLLKLLLNYPTPESVKLSIPTLCDNRFTANFDWLCPVASGCALSDSCTAVDASFRVSMFDVRSPILLLPFVAEIADRTNNVLVLELDNKTIITDGSHIRCSDTGVALMEKATSVVCSVVSASEINFSAKHLINTCRRVVVDTKVWEGLGRFAQHTYVPSTENSRALGAGAGLNDND